jgi:hypothetical protein
MFWFLLRTAALFFRGFGESNTGCAKAARWGRFYEWLAQLRPDSAQFRFETNRRTRESWRFGKSVNFGAGAAACFALARLTEGERLAELDQVIIPSATATVVQMTNLKVVVFWIIAKSSL